MPYYGIETMAYINRETTGKGQISENNRVRRIMAVKKADKRRMGELRMEVGLKESVKKVGEEYVCTESVEKKHARNTDIEMGELR